MVKLVNKSGAEKTLPKTIIFRDVPLSIDMPISPLTGLDGGVKIGKEVILPRQFELRGRIYHPGDKERIRREADELLAFLVQSPIEVYKNNRFLRAYPQSTPHSWIDLGRELEIAIQMLALDPYWYGPEVEVTISGTQTITVDGTAPTIPLITTTGGSGSLTVANDLNGSEVTVSGDGLIEVDSEDMVITVGTETRLDLANDEWLLNGFKLLPGENVITTTRQITMVYRPRWY